MKDVAANLQIKLVAGVASVEFRAGESEPPLSQGGGSPVPVAHLSQCLLIVSHGVHTWLHTHTQDKKYYTTFY